MKLELWVLRTALYHAEDDIQITLAGRAVASIYACRTAALGSYEAAGVVAACIGRCIFKLLSIPAQATMQDDAIPERPCTPRKRLQLAKEEDRKTSQKFTREASIRDFSSSFVGTVLQTAVGTTSARS